MRTSLTLMAAVAASTLLSAGAASAQTAFGSDALSSWTVTANAGEFCRLTTARAVNPNNATVTPGSNTAGGISALEGDGTAVLNLQTDQNTIRGASFEVWMDDSVCNTNHTVTIRSANGGLKYTGSFVPEPVSAARFATLIPYTSSFGFRNNNKGVSYFSNQSGTSTVTSGVAGPTADIANIGVTVQPSNLLLIEGEYTDNVYYSIVPQA
jgi:hypothetical protein